MDNTEMMIIGGVLFVLICYVVYLNSKINELQQKQSNDIFYVNDSITEIKKDMIKYNDPIRIMNTTVGGGDGWQRYITAAGIGKYGDNDGIWRLKKSTDLLQSKDDMK